MGHDHLVAVLAISDTTYGLHSIQTVAEFLKIFSTLHPSKTELILSISVVFGHKSDHYSYDP